MDIRFDLTGEDLRVFQQHVRTSAKGRSRWFAALPMIVAVAGLAGLGTRLPHDGGVPDWRAVVVLVLAGLLAAAFLASVLWTRISGGRWMERSAGRCGITLTTPGLASFGPDWDCFTPWPRLVAFEETSDYFYLYIGANSALILPKSALPQPGQPAEFGEKVRALWRNHPENRGLILPERPCPACGMGRRLSDLGANLRAGCRLAVFRPVTPADFKAAAAALIHLLALQAFLFALDDYAASLPDPRFDSYGLAGYGAGLLLLLLSGTAVDGLASNTASASRFLTMVAGGTTVTAASYLAAYAALERLPGAPGDMALWGLFGMWLVWNLAIVARAVALLYRQPAPAALLLASVFALLNWGIGFYLPERDFFYPADAAEQTAQERRIDGEDLLYRQAALLEAAATDLAEQRPGVTDLYFVGFAGEADERVFANEVGYVRDLFERRFDSAGRSLTLVNSPETIDTLPLANTHNLEAALDAVAGRMDPEQDVLFLFLTSHGSRDHALSVQFRPLPLNDLSAKRLKELLDRSGIRNRVIVVSACYSGGFLDVLKDDRSLIVTAASRDRTSFGCGVESEYTYFGEAYFVRALQEGRSFIDAFGTARALIEERERSEGKEPSLPQLHVGSAIVPKLRELEGRIGALSQAAPNPPRELISSP